MTYNPNDDLVPPKKVYMDDVIVTDPQLGDVPFWKSLLFNTAHLRETMMRADAIIDKQRRHEDQTAKPTAPEEQKAPPLAADSAKRVDDDLIKTLQDACDRLSSRLDRIEAGREAEAALNDLEEAIEKDEEGSTPETIKH